MRFNPIDRVRVSRVRVAREDGAREIVGCWISVNSERDRIGIWLDDARPEPAIVARLEDVEIDWKGDGAEAKPLPLPAA